MAWYSHLFKNFPWFVVIHTVKGFSIVNEADVDVFLEFSSFFYDPTDADNLICGSSAFSFFFYFHLFVFFSFIFISWRLITLQYCSRFCYTLTWISHGLTCIPHPDPPSHLHLYLIPLGLPSAPGPSTCLMHPTWAGDLFHYR